MKRAQQEAQNAAKATRLLGLAAVFAVVLTACQDRTTDDYRQELADQEYAKVAAHSGIYRGTLTQAGVSSPFTFVFGATRKTTTGGSDASAQQQIFATGVLTVYTPAGQRRLSFDNGSYYDRTRQATANVTVSSQSLSGSPSATGGSPVTGSVAITASFADDGTTTGEITADGDQDHKAVFNVLLNGPLPAPGTLNGPQPGPVMGFISYYEGKATFPDNSGFSPSPPESAPPSGIPGKGGQPPKATVTKNVRMSIYNQLGVMPQVSFYEYLLPVKLVDIQFFLGDVDAQVTMPNSALDLRTLPATLTGHAVLGSSGTSFYNVSLGCTAADGGAWNCKYYEGTPTPLGAPSFKVLLSPKGN